MALIFLNRNYCKFLNKNIKMYPKSEYMKKLEKFQREKNALFLNIVDFKLENKFIIT